MNSGDNGIMSLHQLRSNLTREKIKLNRHSNIFSIRNFTILIEIQVELLLLLHSILQIHYYQVNIPPSHLGLVIFPTEH